METIIRVIVVLALDKLSVPDLLDTCDGVVASMKGNPHFPTPDPSLTAVSTAIGDLRVAQIATKNGPPATFPVRDVKRRALLKLMRPLKGYVQRIADEGPPEMAIAVIESAGMGVKGAAVRIKETFVVKPGRLSGSALLILKAIAGAGAYEFSYGTDQTNWTVVSSKGTRFTITGLKPGVTYYFRFRPILSGPAQDWSQAVDLLVR